MSSYELKTKKNNGDVDDFLNKVTDDTRRNDAIKVNKLMQEVTGEKPVMWGSSMVGFGKYTYKNSTGKEYEWMKIGYSPRKEAMTLYVLSYNDSDKEELLAKLGPYKRGKGCLYVKRLEDVDLAILKKLIDKAYKGPGLSEA